MKPLIDPAIGLPIVIWGGWLLAALGAAKVALYLLGEFFPGAYRGIRSATFRKFLTGNGNRLLFGLGGVLTVLVGLAIAFLGLILARVAERL